jgi:hypothetical protein
LLIHPLSGFHPSWPTTAGSAQTSSGTHFKLQKFPFIDDGHAKVHPLEGSRGVFEISTGAKLEEQSTIQIAFRLEREYI